MNEWSLLIIIHCVKDFSLPHPRNLTKLPEFVPDPFLFSHKLGTLVLVGENVTWMSSHFLVFWVTLIFKFIFSNLSPSLVWWYQGPWVVSVSGGCACHLPPWAPPGCCLGPLPTAQAWLCRRPSSPCTRAPGETAASPSSADQLKTGTRPRWLAPGAEVWGCTGRKGKRKTRHPMLFLLESLARPSASRAPFPPWSQVGWLYKWCLGWGKVILSLYEAQLLSSCAPISPPTWASELKPAARRRPSRILLKTRVRCACVFPPLIIHYSLKNDHTVKLTFLGYKVGWFWTLL